MKTRATVHVMMMHVMTMLFTTVISILISIGAAVAQEKDWGKVKCPSHAILAKELLEIEIAGYRLPSGGSNCLKQEKFQYVRLGPQMSGEQVKPYTPTYLDEAKPYEIKSVKENGEGRIEVDFAFYVKESGGRVKTLPDSIEFRRYEKQAKESAGCAAVVYAPETLAVKESCFKR